MNSFKAVAWAKEKGATLPTSKQGDYLEAIKSKGALQALFSTNSGLGTSPQRYDWRGEYEDAVGHFWLAEHNDFDARCQRLTDGHQDIAFRYDECKVLCIQR